MKCRPVRLGGSACSSREAPPPWTDAVDLRRLDWLLVNAEASEDRLSVRERQFVDDLSHRRGTYGDGVRVTERQMAWLEDIVRRVA